MIHILHTPAATLARQRMQRAWLCLLALLPLALSCVFWAHSCLILTPATCGCDFTGITYYAKEEFTNTQAQQKQLPVPQVESLSVDIAPLPQPIVEYHLPEFSPPELPDEEYADEEYAEKLAELAFVEETAPPQTPGRAPRTESAFTPPTYRDCAQPPYPARMRQRRLGGCVTVNIGVGADGGVTDVRISSSSGIAALDTHVQQWILRNWTFTPARRNDQAVPARVETTITFQIQ